MAFASSRSQGRKSPSAVGVRKGLCVPSAGEGERSCVRRAGSEVQAWGSWTRAREEAGNTRPGGHRPFFPGSAVAGEDLLPLPWFPTGARPELGPRCAGRKNRTEPRPGLPSAATPPPSSLGHINPLGPVTPRHSRSWGQRGPPSGRALGRAALPLLAARAAAGFWHRSADGSQGFLRGPRWVTGNC